MSKNAFPNDVEHVIVKLGLLKHGEELVFRCIPFATLGLNSLKELTAVNNLKKYAMEIFDGSKNTDRIAGDYSVALKYNDADGDAVVIFNDFDVYCAMKEYASIGKVKIVAELSLKTQEKPSDSSSRASASTQTFVFNVENQAPSPDISATTEAKDTPNVTKDTPHVRSSTYSSVNDTPPELASSIADILRFAANVAGSATSTHACKAVEKAMKHVNKAAEVVEETAKNCTAAAQANIEHGSQNAVRHAARAARQANRLARKTARIARRSVTAPVDDKNVVLETTGGSTPTANRNAEFCQSGSEVSTESAPNTEVQPEPLVEREFIHGRHTCDSCLTTPIIGKRFHAINRADYDLCENCHKNYEGGNLKFEEEVMERDVSFQDRWHARRAHIMARRSCLKGPSKGSCGLASCQSGYFAPVPPPAPQHPLENPPCARSQIDLSLDHAVNEAIRRSLEDQTELSRGREVAASLLDDASPLHAEVVQVETVEESDPDYHEATSNAGLIQEVVQKADELSFKEEANMHQQREKSVVPSAPIEQHIVAPSAPIELLADTAPISSENMDANHGDAPLFSFVSGGDGETAALLGSTLDRMAEAIDGLKWDLERADAAKDAPLSNLDDDELTEGAKIVDGNESSDDDDDDSDSHDSWSVVAEEEKIAKATQALGSALYNSDIEQSTENVSNLSNSNETNHSSVTGLSTLATVPSVVQSIQLNRWVVQLEQLHELGFTDDAMNVDILESLSAANIGVELDEEVSVQQVVNYLIKD